MQACTFAENPEAVSEETRLYGDNNLILPPLVNLSVTALSATHMYLMDDSLALWLLVGSSVPESELQEVFGLPSLDGYDLSLLRLPLLDNDRSRRLHTLVNELRVDRPYFCPLYVVRATDPAFLKLKWRFVEDRDDFADGNQTYQEFVQNIIGGSMGH